MSFLHAYNLIYFYFFICTLCNLKVEWSTVKKKNFLGIYKSIRILIFTVYFVFQVTVFFLHLTSLHVVRHTY